MSPKISEILIHKPNKSHTTQPKLLANLHVAAFYHLLESSLTHEVSMITEAVYRPKQFIVFIVISRTARSHNIDLS